MLHVKLDNNWYNGFRKRCLKLFKYVIFRYSNWSELTLRNRKKVTVTKLRFRFFFSIFFTVLNTYVSLILHAKIQSKIRPRARYGLPPPPGGVL